MISIIVPIYNVEKTLNRLFKCIKTQYEQNYEVLLIDDGSTDKSGFICDAIVKDDTRFHVYHKENEGAAKARNLGINAAKGEYITFLDADDEVPKNYLSELLNTCISKECDIVVCDVVIIEEGNEKRRFTCKEEVIDHIEALNKVLIRQEINSGPCAKLFRRDIIENITFPSLKAYEDILFVKEAFLRACKVAVINNTEYRYIQNSAGAMNSFLKTPSEDIIIATEELTECIRTNKKLSDEALYVTLSHLMQYAYPLYLSKRKCNDSFVMSVQRLYRKYILDILLCKDFPWKEKIAFCLFSVNLSYRKHA